jgi:hypothetical protein
MNFYGAVKIPHPGTNHQSRKLRAAGKIAEAEIVEARCIAQHEEYLKDYIYAPGCGRYRTEKCECVKCRKL